MISIQYDKQDVIQTINDCLEHYIDALANSIDTVRTHPDAIIRKRIATRLLRKYKILLINIDKPIFKKRNLKLEIDQAIVLMDAVCKYQQDYLPTPYLNSKLEFLKLALHPQMV